MSALHEIVAQHMLALTEVDPETGEVPDDVTARLDAINADLATKCEAIAAVRKRMLADAAANKELSDHYDKRAKSLAGQAERLELYTERALQSAGIPRVQSPTATVWLAKSSRVEAPHVHELPDEYVRVIPEKREADKRALLAALKAGAEVPGAQLVTEERVRFK